MSVLPPDLPERDRCGNVASLGRQQCGCMTQSRTTAYRQLGRPAVGASARVSSAMRGGRHTSSRPHHSRNFARSRAIDWLCSWQTRLSVTPSTAAISFRFMSCS
jgi:hypothetical protein